ncbi:tetratricopeptide repeat protein [Limnoraphis robusta Tam1]|jgi:tetratricopeptide (TPR) repeat protein|uniref:Tetratricopeptide repeat protein n=1 Tax=Limnoraphis robusta CCNP1315 TaxID=3110306 RepID=A0ABU5U6K4_9CYAN|nr:tetratricopeptide repeat protein [Limnoraphis robusta]MEA5497478.1 tetratricopeptide repeat protein [Limnoraphis robusta BA-68 BA1]MEA5522794.1 tetratricopeptide repeat protein [Limnoraphis robusta CCNP1315]MEA5540579.1 tetratricopeptide repeat protein [Limnoraphis robusta Tam1]MEA5549024.1 tetratricopeptide repeat protein [Limnoraphis robusta CCNP1324]
MNSSLPVVYLLLLVALLFGVGFFVLRQIIRTRRVESQLSRLQSKLAQDQGTAQEYYELGCIYNDKKLYSQAIAVFQKALKVPNAQEEESQNLALVHNALGYAYFAKEQYDIAIRQYKEALKLAPDYVTAYNNLGYAYERKKLTAQALEAYEQALQGDPRNAIARRRSESLRKRLGIPSSLEE